MASTPPRRPISASRPAQLDLQRGRPAGRPAQGADPAGPDQRHGRGAGALAAWCWPPCAREGWISAADEQAALATPPKLAPEAPGEGDFGYVLDMAAAQAVQIAGGQAPDLVVKLTIDSGAADHGPDLVRDAIAEARAARRTSARARWCCWRPTAAIRALVGGARPPALGLQPRDPGPAPAGLVVQALRLRRGAGERASSRPTSARTRRSASACWSPGNYGGGYRGRGDAGRRPWRTRSTPSRCAWPARSAADKIGEIAHRFGLKSIPDDPDLSIALGAYEVNLLELTSGYQVFQQGGQRNEPYLIEQIATDARRRDLRPRRLAPAPWSMTPPTPASMVRMMEGRDHRRHRDPRRLRPPGRRQDRHQPGLARRLVRRLHPRLGLRRLGRQRRRRADAQGHRRRDAGRDLAADDDRRAPERADRTTSPGCRPRPRRRRPPPTSPTADGPPTRADARRLLRRPLQRLRPRRRRRQDRDAAPRRPASPDARAPPPPPDGCDRALAASGDDEAGAAGRARRRRTTNR